MIYDLLDLCFVLMTQLGRVNVKNSADSFTELLLFQILNVEIFFLKTLT